MEDTQISTQSTAPARANAAPKRPWGTIGLTALVTALALSAAGYFAIGWEPVREAVDRAVSPGRPLTSTGSRGLRSMLIGRRDGAVSRGDVVSAAEINADLAHEALVRAYILHRRSFARRDPNTKLYPQQRSIPHWNYRNTAADFFAFHLQTGMRLNPDGMPSLLETLEAESSLSPPGELCRPVHAHTGEPIDADEQELLFASSEYVKDGLISVFERFGDGPASVRMLAVLDAVVKHSRHGSKQGPIPGTGSEVNGNVLQVCSRLSFAVDRPEYAEIAARIAEAYVQQAMPANQGIPPAAFDFSRGDVIEPVLKLKDHGNEVLPGLSEAFALAVARRDDPTWRDRADRWAEPLAVMFETILDKGRDERGLLARELDPTTMTALTPKQNDNWGYVLNAALLFAQAARVQEKLPPQRIDALEARVDAIIAAVLKQDGLEWEGGMDGYADAMESGLYMAAYRPACRAGLLSWVDRQIEYMFSAQKSGGAVADHYLDGNFLRTSLMYADARTGGWRVEPWRGDVRVGFAADEQGRAAVVVSTDKPYRGVLVPDSPRHRTIMRLPWNWPRLNSWPEWFEVTDQTRIVSADGLEGTPMVPQLQQGLKLSLPAHGRVTLVLTTEPAPAAAASAAAR